MTACDIIHQEEECMEDKIQNDGIYRPSDDIVARDIEGELIIVPLTSRVGDIEDELFTLNDTGRANWEKLDGRRTIEAVAQELADEYEASVEEVRKDVVGLALELAKRRIIIEASEA
jgi:hypothetical protein